MAAAYASAQSYRDSGVVRTTWSGWLGHSTQRPFETAFVRGGSFRFGYTNQAGHSLFRLLLHADDQMVIWGTVDSANLWWTIGFGRVEHSSLSSALASAYGVSGGSSGTIPALLMPETISGGTDDPDESKPVAVEAIQGHDCYKVSLKCDRETEEVWIDRDSFLLRRAREVSEQGGMTVVEVTAYDSVINIEIPDAVFRFEPPK
jgi:outer membrane lipoprotein-sorting protein